MPELPEDILRQVVRYQEQSGYSDQQMAQRIGVSRPLYQRTRTGKVPVGGRFLKGAMALREIKAPYLVKGGLDLEGVSNNLGERRAAVRRRTGETNVSLEISLDGSGRWEINTGVRIFDHLLAAFARHGLFDLKLTATGDDTHHLVEDVAICLGRAFNEALEEKRGIVRMADVRVPMDEALASVVVDLSGRGYAVMDLAFGGGDLPDLPADLVRHFLETFTAEARLNLHAAVLYGRNDHHKAEALFKALGRALDAATRLDARLAGESPSTKGLLER
jgi:imidazoleglycerol-phosphate dehydratase